MQAKLRLPLERGVVELQIAFQVGNDMAQVIEHLAQVGARMDFVKVGPKQKGNLLAAQRLVTMESEIGQERLQPRLRGGRYRRLLIAQVKAAQKTKVKDGHSKLTLPPARDRTIIKARG